MRRLIAVQMLLIGALPSEAHARPYRVVNAHGPSSTGGGNLELGLRYQGFFVGQGRDHPTLGHLEPGSFNQLAGTVRWGIIDPLELGLEASAIFFHDLDSEDVEVAAGDLIVSLQGRVLKTRHHLLGLFAGLTVPTGPSDVDSLPPFWADGTLDVEALLLYELALQPFRLIVDAGYVHAGTRDPTGGGLVFDVPDAFRWDLAGALHLGRRFLVCLELHGRHYFRADVTPFWVDNQHLLELIPGVRVELVPRLVLEAALGFALTRAAREMFILRAQAGFTYEFNLY
jgi:hypothetical protein